MNNVGISCGNFDIDLETLGAACGPDPSTVVKERGVTAPPLYESTIYCRDCGSTTNRRCKGVSAGLEPMRAPE